MNLKAYRNKIIRAIPFLCYLNIVTNISKLRDIIGLQKLKVKSGTLVVENEIDYKRVFLNFCLADCANIDVVKEFYLANITIGIEKFDRCNVKPEDPILVCIIKDDVLRIREFMHHYRSLGIKHFAFLDNGSTDGTKEYLMSQDDVNLYLCGDTYSTFRREAWINRLYAYFGYKHWYVCVDSDELIIYDGCDKHNIVDAIKTIGRKRILALMIDMYPKGDVLNQASQEGNSFLRYRFYDRSSYYKKSSYRMEALYGGPRNRLFSTKDNGFNCRLTKYPITYYDKGDVQGCSHYSFPFKFNYSQTVSLVILHYKFFKSDINKYKERALKGNYSSGSLEYKVYLSRIEENRTMVFYNSEFSNELNSHNDLKKLCIKGIDYVPLFS